MPTLTTNYNFNKPLVNNATDADLWGGYLNANWDSVDTLLGSAGQLPVKSVFFTIDNTNPNTLLGYGTWAAIAEGRFIVGVGEGTDANTDTRTYPAGNDSVGEYDHTLTAAEQASMAYSVASRNLTDGTARGFGAGLSGGLIGGPNNNGGASSTYTTDGGTTLITDNAGGGAHENSPPAFGLYVWERTA